MASSTYRTVSDSQPMVVPFTCMTCRVGFHTEDAQRNHYKTDWHRYNLKRKMADLGPVSAADFRTRVIQQQQQAKQQLDQESADTSWKCAVCNARFKSENAYNNHLQSKKHKERMKRAESGASRSTSGASTSSSQKRNDTQVNRLRNTVEDSVTASTESSVRTTRRERIDLENESRENDDEEKSDVDKDQGNEDEDEPEPDRCLDLNDCIFCNHRSENLEENLIHMAYAHGFFVPDLEYCIDLPGLIKYLQDKVTRYHLCLLCNGKGRAFHSSEAARSHMITKGHCFVEYDEDGQAELEEFYDFKPSWEEYFKKHPNARLDEEEVASSASANNVNNQGNDAVDDNDDDDWEDVDDDGDDVSDAGDDVMEAEGKSSTTIVPMSEAEKHRALLARNRGQVQIGDYEMILPSGKAVGHRSLRKYYKQKFGSPDERDSVVIQKLVSEYNAIGLPGYANSTAPTPAARRARDVFNRAQMKAQMQQGSSNNRSYQNRFFRIQVVQY